MLTKRDAKHITHIETGQTVPMHTLEALIRYRDQGVPTGDFLQAFLANDLMRALGKADPQNQRNFVAIGYFVYNAMPSTCHGSYERICAWIEKHNKKDE